MLHAEAWIAEGVSNLPLIRRCGEALLTVGQKLSLLHLSIDEDSDRTMLDQVLEGEPGHEARLAELFLDLYYCSNFPDTQWHRIIADEPQLAGLACEHAFYVAYLSGVDDARLAARILTIPGARDHASAHIAELAVAGLPAASAYLRRVLSFGT